MILEPVLDAALVKIVLYVARQRHDALFRLELTQANAALVLVRQALRAPLNLEHCIENLSCLTSLSTHLLRPMEPLVEEVGNEAGEEDGSEEEHYRWEGPNDQCNVVDQLQNRHWFLSTRGWCLHDASEVLQSPETESSVVVDAESERKAKEGLIVARCAVSSVDEDAGEADWGEDPSDEVYDFFPRINTTLVYHRKGVFRLRYVDD